MGQPVLPVNVQLVTARLRLREFNLADAPAYFAYRRLPETTAYVPEAPLATVAEAEIVLARLIARQFAAPRRHLLLAIVLPGSRASLIGEVGLHSLAEEETQAELGFMLAPAHWGQGYAFEAAETLLRFARQRGAWRQVTATCDVDNPASARILARLGFQQTGYLPRHFQKEGVWHHSLRFDLVAG